MGKSADARRRMKFGIAALVAAGAMVAAPQGALASHRTYDYAVAAADFRFVGVPSRLPTADYDTHFINIGHAPHVVVALHLGPECQDLTTAEAIAIFDLGEEGAFEACPGLSVNGEAFAFGGARSQGTLTVKPGQNWFVCFVDDHYQLGMLKAVQGISVE